MKKHIGLFIDLDNAQIAADNLNLTHCRTSALWVGALIAELERGWGGVVSVRRAYGDALLNATQSIRENVWNTRVLRDEISSDLEFQIDLANNGFQMVHCPKIGGSKNRSDILMALDCMEMAGSASHIDIYAVMSQDSDFSALLHRLRALGKDVILITAGQPSGRSWRTLKAMANGWLVYDQSVVDRAGFNSFTGAIEELMKTDPTSFKEGVALPAIHARVLQQNPTFTYEAIGFNRFLDFVDSCIEPPLLRSGNTLRMILEQDVEIPKATLDVPAQIISSPQPITRDQHLLASLKKQQIRPLPDPRRQIGRWLRQELFDSEGKPLESLTYGELSERVQQHLGTKGYSKTVIADALRVLSMSGLIRLDKTEGLPLRSAPVNSLAPIITSRTNVVSFIVQRLQGAGEVLTDSDIETLAQIVFGSTERELLDATREGLRLAKGEEESEVNTVNAEGSDGSI